MTEEIPDQTPAEREQEERWLQEQYQKGTRVFLSNKPEHWEGSPPRICQLAAERLKKQILDRWPYIQVEIVPVGSNPIGPEGLLEEVSDFIIQNAYPILEEIIMEHE